MKNTVINVEELKREYVKRGFFGKTKKVVKAVDGISFNVEQGEIFGLLGQNGAGKTTTIKMLTTLLAPTSGTCEVLGYKTFGEEKKIRSRINFIFGGEMGVYRRLSARDNLRYFSNLYLIPEKVQKERIESILKLVDLADRADDLAETYSKGMIQRLQIARGLINDPEILFMDEPTVGLDPVGARMLRDIIKNLKADGRTVLLTTHNLAEVEELCDRLVIINKGKVIAKGTPSEIKGHEATLEDAYVKLVQEVTA
ncbi:MAG: ABC transporter ATP-binding protein [Lachnospiraceae bacterium]|nr:ABC transporter ATP-binding protein [Lachnospiraceae bacterium]